MSITVMDRISVSNMDVSGFTGWFSNLGLSVTMRLNEPALWDAVLEKCSYVPVAYTSMNIDFLYELQNGNGVVVKEISSIITWDHKPVAVWPLFLSLKDDKYVPNCLDGRVLPPLFVESCADNVKKKISKLCLTVVNQLSEEMKLSRWQSMELFSEKPDLSPWHMQAMTEGARCSLEYEVFIDLAPGLDQIMTHFRKSYRSLINSGKRRWPMRVLENADDTATWNDFKALHLQAAGRKTRSDKTWEIHLADIEAGRSFLIYLRDESGAMIGAGLFNTTKNEALYASGAYDRSLSDKPLGHVVQYYAIQELKRRGVRWYKLGPRPFASQVPEPSPKEIAIGEFKQGFASHVFTRLVLDRSVANHSSDKKTD